MKGPSKQKATAGELQLQRQGIARASSAEKITNSVQPHFLALSKQDATDALKRRASADGAQQINQLASQTSDVQQKQNIQSVGNNSVSGSAVQAHATALGNRDGKMLNAVNTAAGQQNIALGGTASVARMQTEAQNADLQRKIAQRATNLGALTTVGTGVFGAYSNNNGMFADGTKNVNESVTGQGILSSFGSGNNQPVDSFDLKMLKTAAANGA
jgi:hypothetical protein